MHKWPFKDKNNSHDFFKSLKWMTPRWVSITAPSWERNNLLPNNGI